MSLFAFGLNHKTAPIEVREKVVFASEVLSDALRDLVSCDRAKEAAILSTCNRTEIYFEGSSPASVAGWLAEFHGLPERLLAAHCYTLPRDEAVAHAFRVASGLDSMVLGEPQILGQMKHAVRSAESVGSLGLVLSRLFQHTFAVAKDVRTQTDIGTATVSLAAASVKLAERVFASFRDQRLLLIGAGEMIELAASHFVARMPRSVTVANRSLERGRNLADRLGAEAITLDDMRQRFHEFDIVVTCTASTLPIIGKGMLETVSKQRRHAPVFIVDFGVPRDVEPEAAELDDVFLYSIDDLQGVVRENLALRQEAVAQAEQMIAHRTTRFLHWLEGRSLVPVIQALASHHDGVSAGELERARRILAAGASPTVALETLARGLTSKLLHAPLSALNAAGGAERAELMAALTRAYRLNVAQEGAER